MRYNNYMVTKFVLDKNSNIIIYGAATMGSILLDRLNSMNVHVKGFIDKRAYEIKTLKGYPVWDINDKKLHKQMDESTVIIIAVKNVFQHQGILMKLLECTTCRNYIYMPIQVSDKNSQMMKEAFNDVFYNDIVFPYELETVNDVCMNSFERADNRRVINNEVVILVPVGFIFTNNIDTKKSIWGDICILAYFPHIRLFQFFEGIDSGEVESYLEFCMNASENMGVLQSDSWKNNVLENRKNVYDEMLNEYELSLDFFYNNAPSAIWNSKGYFNLTSGKHRATFLASKKCRYIPLRISIEDEAKWINYKVAEETYSYLNSVGVHSLEYTVDNPYFYRFKNEYGDFWNVVLAEVVCRLAEYLYKIHGKVSFDKIKILNLYEKNRYLARYLYKMGANVIDLNEEQELEKVMDNIFCCRYIPQRELVGNDYELVITKRMEKKIEEGRLIKFAVCQEYDDMYEEKVIKIGTTIGNNGIVNMYLIEF